MVPLATDAPDRARHSVPPGHAGPPLGRMAVPPGVLGGAATPHGGYEHPRLGRHLGGLPLQRPGDVCARPVRRRGPGGWGLFRDGGHPPHPDHPGGLPGGARQGADLGSHQEAHGPAGENSPGGAGWPRGGHPGGGGASRRSSGRPPRGEDPRGRGRARGGVGGR